MYKECEILNKLNELKQFSIDKNSMYENGFVSIIEGAKQTVTEYFNCDRSQFKKPLEDLCLYAYNDLWQRNAKFEFEFEMNFDPNIPNCFNNFRLLFFTFQNLMNVDNATFYDAWIYETDAITGLPKPSKNAYLDLIVSELKTACENELKEVQTLSKWIENDLQGGSMVSLFENQGKLLNVMNTEQIANEIFIKRGLLEAVTTLNINIHIPTYLRGVQYD